MALSQKGVDVRQTGTSIQFRAFLQTQTGALLGTGTTVLSLVELQSDGSIKSYDFNDNTFKSTALTTPTLAMTHRPSNNAVTTTGLWTVSLGTVSGFTVGGIYFALVNNAGAGPTDQMREFQYGGDQGDLLTLAGSTGQAYLQGDTEKWLGGTIPAVNVTGVPKVDMVDVAGVAQTGGDIYPAVANIGTTAAPQNANAASRTITTGTETGTLSNANTLDGVFHNVADVAGTLDFYYQFDLSGITNAFVTSGFWNGYVVGVVNTIKVYAYNWAGASWDQVGSITGIAGTVVSADDFDLTNAHIGTGGNVGLVRIRFSATGLTAATVKTDRILLGYGVTPSTLDAPGIRSAVGLASANLDTQLAEIEGETDDIAAVKAKTDNLPASPAAVGSAMTLTAGERIAINAAIDAATVEGTITKIQAERIKLSAMVGKSSGHLLNVPKYRDTTDTKDRISATTSPDGRLTVTLDGS